MNILALDFGEKRIGFAFGNTKLKIAFPKNILEYKHLHAGVLGKIADTCIQENVQNVLVGHPGALSQEGSIQAKKCRNFADMLEDYFLQHNIHIPVEFVDEAFSTKIASAQLRAMGKSEKQQKGQKDALAAAAFLQTYLDRK